MYVGMKCKVVFTGENKAASHRCRHRREQEREADAPRLLEGVLRLTWLYNKPREQVHPRVPFH